MRALHKITFLLLVVGGLNWLLIGLFDMDLVARLGDTVARVVYILVGLSAVSELVMHKHNCKACMAGKEGHMGMNPGQM